MPAKNAPIRLDGALLLFQRLGICLPAPVVTELASEVP